MRRASSRVAWQASEWVGKGRGNDVQGMLDAGPAMLPAASHPAGQLLSRAEAAEASLKQLSAQVQQLSSELSESRRRATESEAQGVTLGERLRESEAKGTEAAAKLAASLASAEELKSQIRAKDSSLETVTSEFSNQVCVGTTHCAALGEQRG